MANPTFKITMENGGVIEGELYPDKAPQSEDWLILFIITLKRILRASL